MPVAEKATFTEMARAFPVRTGVFTLVPVCFVLFQLANSYVNGGSLPFTAAFAALFVAYAVLVNRYHLAAYRRADLSPRGRH